VDNLALLWEGNDPATMRGRLHGECCFTPSLLTLRTFEGLVHVPADDAAWAAHSQAQNRRLSRCRRPSIGRRGQSNSAGLPEEPTEEPTAAGFTPRKSNFEIGI
jgi:hypothetical protein